MKGLRAVTAVLGVVVLLVAVPVAAIAIDTLAVSDDHAATPPMSSGMSGMSSSGGMMASGSATVAAPAAEELTIVHVQKGCHVWSTGAAQMPTMHVTMKPGQMLRIMNQDVDMHRMMELAGPQHMMLGGPMRQGQVDAITFTAPGTYRFDTKVSPMMGMPEVETTGPDNTLRLTVTVT
jgi:plastocyanin